MTMRAQILKVAAHVGSPEKSARENALARGWIDMRGLPTEKGYRLVDALSRRSFHTELTSDAA